MLDPNLNEEEEGRVSEREIMAYGCVQITWF